MKGTLTTLTLAAMVAVTSFTVSAATPTITGVTAQRYPGNGKVYISYKVTGDIAATAKERGLITSLKVTATDKVVNKTYTATKLSGDMALTAGTHSFVWDLGSEGLSLKSTNVVVTVACEKTPALYCIVDLSDGSNATSYAVSYSNLPPSGGFNVDTYKTSKLVLRRIECGAFKMQNTANVLLTRPYYVGVFTITQKQWELVKGYHQSAFAGDKRPVEQVSWEMIRGSPATNVCSRLSVVDPDSFVGRLVARTGVDFDLPTEAQWEYACRAGTTSSYNNGGSSGDDLKQLGRYWYNQSDGKGGYSSKHTSVGSYIPNAWELYDMHGNVWEWCLDWYGGLTYGTDPEGPHQGSHLVLRGGSWSFVASGCTSSVRSKHVPTYYDNDSGFRIARTLAAVELAGDLCSGTSSAIQVISPENPVILPESGMTFSTYLSVSISCPTYGANIYYTINGKDPSVDSEEYRRFRIYGKTTVKAVAEKDGWLSEVVAAEYALGRCEDPCILPTDGTAFKHPNHEVSIRWNEADGVLRYTLDGTDPTAESQIYNGPFSVSDSVEVRAKVFSDNFFDSAVVTSRLTRVWENVATPVIDAVEAFTGSKTKVVISCATDGALVRYTLNGNEPNSHSTKYTGPFYVTDSCTVRAYAVKTDYLNSAVATHAIEKVWGIGDSLGKPDHGFVTEGYAGAGWTRVEDATVPNGEAMKSGAISNSQTSTLSTTVVGSGTLSFLWRTSCEEDPDEYYEWDHVELSVDGTVIRQLDGETTWTNEVVRIEGDCAHTVAWTYKKDDVESVGDDAAWVAGYGWESDLTETQTTDVHVPYAWLLGHHPEIVDEYDAYEAAAKVTGINGHKVWESYVIGADPNDKDDSLKITAFNIKADGTPDFDTIEISPAQSKWNVQGATLVLKGKATLDCAGEWQEVTDENKAGMRFFKVEIKLP